MHRLSRQIRFCIDPLADKQPTGANGFGGKPTARGLCFFLELGIELVGELDPDTGFIVNVCEIDKHVRQAVVPIFVDRICNRIGRRRPLDTPVLLELLSIAHRALTPCFDPACVAEVRLHLTPYRKLSFRAEEDPMAYYSERFEFAATHKLWNDRLSEAQNLAAFGKCANASGHGHNYVVEVTVALPAPEALDMCDFQENVDSQVINELDHKNLNVDVPYFREAIPTIENIAKFSWGRLVDQLGTLRLHSVTIWESERTSCTYYG